MAVKNWNASFGLFSSHANWSPGGAPVAGDNLYVSSGVPILYNETFGAAGAPSSIGLTSTDASQPSELIAWNATLANVTLDNAPPAYTGPVSQRPADYFTGRHGVLIAGGTVTNDGGTIEAGRSNLFFSGNSLDIVLAPQSTLVNKGVIYASPGNTMAISGYGGSALENDGTMSAAGGQITVATELSGVGSVNVTRGPPGFGGFVELKAAVDAGQTFNVNLAAIQIDKPMSFLGQVALNAQQGGGKVTLEGLAAQSWDVNGSAVEFFDAAGSVIDTLRLTTPQDPAGLKVYAAPDATYGSAVSVSNGRFFGTPSTATVLPYHTAAAA